MITIERINPETIAIKPPEEALIECVAEDYEQYKNFFQRIWAPQNQKLEIHFSHIQEIDTAYLQLLLSCLKYAQQKSNRVFLIGTSSSVQNIINQYGIKLSHLTGEL